MACKYLIILHQNARYAFHQYTDGSSAFQRTIDTIHMLAGGVDDKYIVQIQDSTMPTTKCTVPADYQLIQLENSSEVLVETLLALSSEGGHICITWADNMMQYSPLYEAIYATHTRYTAHYSFCEGYPIGISPIYLSAPCIEMLQSIVRNKESIQVNNQYEQTITRTCLFSILETRINDFDIEAHLSKQDMRELRLSLTGDTRNNFVISKHLYEQNIRNPDDIYEVFFQKPALFRGTPLYIYFQITNTVFPCSYLPERPNKGFTHIEEGSSVDLEVFKTCLAKLKEFSPEAIVCLGYNGEVSVHSEFPRILEIACSHFASIYVETTGRNWQAHLAHDFWTKAWMQQVTWIISIDAQCAETYEAIHYVDMAESLDFVEFLLAKIAKDTLYVQATRIPENEQDLEGFMKHWKSKGANPIIQKYNDYCATLPDKKIVNLAPITRLPCVHLARDLVVLLNGEVLQCAQAQDTRHIIANLLTQSMEKVWDENQTLYAEHAKNNYPNICANCDQYYIVNA